MNRIIDMLLLLLLLFRENTHFNCNCILHKCATLTPTHLQNDTEEKVKLSVCILDIRCNGEHHAITMALESGRSDILSFNFYLIWCHTSVDTNILWNLRNRSDHSWTNWRSCCNGTSAHAFAVFCILSMIKVYTFRIWFIGRSCDNTSEHFAVRTNRARVQQFDRNVRHITIIMYFEYQWTSWTFS